MQGMQIITEKQCSIAHQAFLQLGQGFQLVPHHTANIKEKKNNKTK